MKINDNWKFEAIWHFIMGTHTIIIDRSTLSIIQVPDIIMLVYKCLLKDELTKPNMLLSKALPPCRRKVVDTQD